MTKYSAALDLSGKEAAFSVVDTESGRILFELCKSMIGREASSLMQWVIDCLSAHALKPENISEWVAGTGPGSFTGLRIVAAIIEGMNFGGMKVNSKGIPSALAFAASIENLPEKVKIAVLFDARNKEAVIFKAEKDGNKFQQDGPTEIINSENSSSFLAPYKYFVSPETDREALSKIIPGETFSKIMFFEHFPVSKLIFLAEGDNCSRASDLLYTRPSVFVKPKESRQII